MQNASPRTYAIAYFSTFIVLVCVDFVWLGSMADRLYRPVMGDMLAPQFRLMPALLFYLLYAAGLTYLAVRAGLASSSVRTAMLNGAILGFTAYATYDLTNQSTLKNWSTTLTIADLIWGTVLSAIAAGAGTWITRRLLRSSAGPAGQA